MDFDSEDPLTCWVYFGALQSGSLESRSTDFGFGDVSSLEFYFGILESGVYSLTIQSLDLRISDLRIPSSAQQPTLRV